MRVKKWFNKVAVIVAVATVMVSVVGCQKKTKEETEPASTSSETKQDQTKEDQTKQDQSSSDSAKAENGQGYKIGWSTIYLTPSWMQQTKGMMEDRIEYWKEQGVVSDFTIANANGDTAQQIAQIENMISQNYDAIVVIAGSSTALNNVIDKAYDKGIVITNIDGTNRPEMLIGDNVRMQRLHFSVFSI